MMTDVVSTTGKRNLLLVGAAMLVPPVALAYILFQRSVTLRSSDLGLDIQASLLGAGFLVAAILNGIKRSHVLKLLVALLAHFVLSTWVNQSAVSWSEHLEISYLRKIAFLVAMDLWLFAALVYVAPVSAAKEQGADEPRPSQLRRFPQVMMGLVCAIILAIAIRFGFVNQVASHEAAGALQVTTHFVVVALWILLASRAWLGKYAVSASTVGVDDSYRLSKPINNRG
jgi:hypothetical protein